MIRNYRSKPTVIKAVQLNWVNWNDVCELVGDAINPDNPGRSVALPPDEVPDTCGEVGPFIELTLTTMHGEQAIFRHGDWIIPDGKPGTFYPCNPRVFAEKYEPV